MPRYSRAAVKRFMRQCTASPVGAGVGAGVGAAAAEHAERPSPPRRRGARERSKGRGLRFSDDSDLLVYLLYVLFMRRLTQAAEAEALKQDSRIIRSRDFSRVLEGARGEYQGMLLRHPPASSSILQLQPAPVASWDRVPRNRRLCWDIHFNSFEHISHLNSSIPALPSPASQLPPPVPPQTASSSSSSSAVSTLPSNTTAQHTHPGQSAIEAYCPQCRVTEGYEGIFSACAPCEPLRQAGVLIACFGHHRFSVGSWSHRVSAQKQRLFRVPLPCSLTVQLGLSRH